VVKFCQQNSQAKIIIAEGSGGCDTNKAFSDLGYLVFSKQPRVTLMDLNRAPRIEKEDQSALRLKKVLLPKIAFESFIINLPVLKIHSAAKMTACMKNLYGFYLNRNFIFKKIVGGPWWNKSELHFFGVNQSIIDLNRYIKTHFNLVDASLGQLGGEVRGFPCQPPLGKIIAGFDPKAVDIACAPLLGLSPAEIVYLNKK